MFPVSPYIMFVYNAYRAHPRLGPVIVLSFVDLITDCSRKYAARQNLARIISAVVGGPIAVVHPRRIRLTQSAQLEHVVGPSPTRGA